MKAKKEVRKKTEACIRREGEREGVDLDVLVAAGGEKRNRHHLTLGFVSVHLDHNQRERERERESLKNLKEKKKGFPKLHVHDLSLSIINMKGNPSKFVVCCLHSMRKNEERRKEVECVFEMEERDGSSVTFG